MNVVVRSGYDEMKASPWEKEDARHEGIPIHNFLVPKVFTHDNGKLTGVTFEKVAPQRDAKGRRQLVPTGEPDVHFPCDDVLVAIGQENAFPWIERDLGLAFDEHGMPVVDPITMALDAPNVFFGGDAAFGPKNIIWAVAHGHDAAISIDLLCRGEDLRKRPPPHTNLVSQKMGIHEWSYDNAITSDHRFRVPLKDTKIALKNIKIEVELGYDAQGSRSPRRSGASTATCRRCSATSCASSATRASTSARWTASRSPPTARRPTCAARLQAPALNLAQDLYVSGALKTGRVMAKDEDVCLHCGLCAERCPTGAWDMQKFLLDMAQADDRCRVKHATQPQPVRRRIDS